MDPIDSLTPRPFQCAFLKDGAVRRRQDRPLRYPAIGEIDKELSAKWRMPGPSTSEIVDRAVKDAIAAAVKAHEAGKKVADLSEHEKLGVLFATRAPVRYEFNGKEPGTSGRWVCDDCAFYDGHDGRYMVAIRKR